MLDNKIWKPQKPPFRLYKKKVFNHASTTGQFIYQIGESELLLKPSLSVPLEDITSKNFQAKVSYLKRSLRKYRKLTGKGRGIAAVQLGIPERFAVIHLPAGRHGLAETKPNLLIIINPIITRKSTTLLKYPEMCMSANPIIARVVRPSWIEFEYYDEKGKKQEWNMKSNTKEGKLYNRVFQHEIDHMDGIINIDKVASKELILESDPRFYDTATFEQV